MAEILDEHDEPAPARAASQEIATRRVSALATEDVLSVAELVRRRDIVVDAMDKAMKDGVHYGKVPGVNKPALLKPGAELLCVLFKLSPSFPDERLSMRWLDDGHLDVRAACVLTHFPTGLVVAEGVGLCSTRESKYAFRNARLTCPNCGVEAIFRSKYPPKGSPAGTVGGYWCSKREGGCGAEFLYTDGQIADQKVGKVANDSLPDTYNTVLKMGCKRALTDAVLHATGASDVFTQDVEEGQPSPDDTPFVGATGDEPKPSEGEEPAAAKPSSAPASAPQQLRFGSVKDTLAYLDEITSIYPWIELLGQSVRKLYGASGVTRYGDLSNDQKWDVLRRINRLADVLNERDFDAQCFPPPTREDVIESFAACFEVQVELADDVGISRADVARVAREVRQGKEIEAPELSDPPREADPPAATPPAPPSFTKEPEQIGSAVMDALARMRAAQEASQARKGGAGAGVSPTEGATASTDEAEAGKSSTEVSPPVEGQTPEISDAAASWPTAADYRLAKSVLEDPAGFGVEPYGDKWRQASQIVTNYEADSAAGLTE